MRTLSKFSVLAALALSTGACYHATVTTGLEPSLKTVENKWASSWVYGLVPPKPIDTKATCVNGPAKVDTQLSLPNMIVGALTLGIYTPMEVVTTCADAK